MLTVSQGFGKERSLASYCAPGQGINILIIGSITPQATGSSYPTGIFGSNCTVETDGSFNKGCAGVAQDIATCQAAGVKILTGFSSYGNWGINGESGASTIASQLWSSYGGDLSGPYRPFGNVKVDGFDFDVESNPKNQSKLYLGDLVNDLRGHFASDTSKKYYISGAPQCPTPEPNMGPAMQEAKFDYLWIQFYNNFCSAADLYKNIKQNPDGTGQYNFGKWRAYLANGASSAASLFVGLPASLHAADTYDYNKPGRLPLIIKSSPGAAGVMLWNTYHSDTSAVNGCTYAQQVAHVFQTGSICPKK